MPKMLLRALLVALCLLVPATAQTQAPPTVRIAYIPIENAAQVLYAREQGFFTKAGLNAEIQPMSFAAAIASAVASGAVDIGYASITTLAIAHSKGIPLVIVASASLNTASRPPAIGMVVAANSPIRSAADLNGRTLATAGLGTLTEFAPRAWMDANGGNSATIKWVEVPTAETAAAVAAGRVDAGILFEPFFTAAKNNPAYRFLPWKPTDGIANDFLAAAWFATPKWAHEHPDAVRRFAAAMREAATWANRNPPGIADVLVKGFGADPAVVAAVARVPYAERLTPALVQPVIDVTARYAKFPPFRAEELIYTP
jgi:NitT/TauT family transport system substrate-binding protein